MTDSNLSLPKTDSAANTTFDASKAKANFELQTQIRKDVDGAVDEVRSLLNMARRPEDDPETDEKRLAIEKGVMDTMQKVWKKPAAVFAAIARNFIPDATYFSPDPALLKIRRTKHGFFGCCC